MTTYQLNCTNNTGSTWVFGVFQKVPHFEGLVSLAWKRSSIPQKGTALIEWDVDYNVALTDFKQINGIGVASSEQSLSTDLGKVWECRYVNGVQQLFPVDDPGAVNPGELLIRNRSGRLANLGLGMFGTASIIQPNVEDGANAQFVVQPKYYLGLFNRLYKGEIIKSNVAAGPIELAYSDGLTKLDVTAQMNGATIQMIANS